MSSVSDAASPTELSLLADQLPVGICLIDREFQVTLWNETLAGWTGQPAEEVVGHSLLQLFPHLTQAGYRERIESVFDTGEPVECSAEAELHFVPARAKPSEFPIDAAGDCHSQLMIQRTTLRRHPADSELVLIVIEDITELYRQATARRERQKNLEAMSRSLAAATWDHTEFIANMSQELRLPLHTIFGYAEFLREQETAPDRRAALEGLRRNGDKLVTVINDVLDYTKIEAQQVRIDRVPLELRPLLNDIVSLVRLAAAENGSELAFECDKNVPCHLVSDPTRLRQVLLNLLTNAVTYTEAGNIRLAVSLHQTDAGPVVQFEVSDTGVGISPERMEHLFQPFPQDSSCQMAHRKRGTGLGLAISQRLTQLLGGRLTATSELDQGSTFTLMLPAAEVA